MLSFNRISWLPDGVFDGLFNLSDLFVACSCSQRLRLHEYERVCRSLEHNELTALPVDALRDLSSLLYLYDNCS